METSPRFTYRGARRNTISFPLGGIGTGCIGLTGTGRLMDWEIYNRPNKSSLNGFSHFAIKAEREGQVRDARVLHADLPPPYTGQVLPGARFHGFGFGPERHLMSGVPHFQDCTFTGIYPFADVDFHDETFPGHVRLSAFNPFIPLDDKDSTIPAAFFEIEVENTTGEALDYTVSLSVANPLSGGTALQRLYRGRQHPRDAAFAARRGPGRYPRRRHDVRRAGRAGRQLPDVLVPRCVV